jgi:hypothetical protein
MSVPGPIVLTNNNPQLIRPHATNQTLTFYWTAPSSDGGSAITGYDFHEISPTDQLTQYGPTIRAITIPSLTNGTEYAYEIAARNENGLGPYSQFRVVQPGNKPSIVTSMTLTNVKVDDSYNLTWVAPSSDGGATIKWYVITINNSFTGATIVKSSTYGTDRQKTYYGLGPNLDYYINAVNDPGYSPTLRLPSSLITLVASTYSGSGTWLNSSQNSDIVVGATLGGGSIAKNTAGNGIVLDGSTYWTFPNVLAGSIWSLLVWYKNTGEPTIDPSQSGSYAQVVTQILSGADLNLMLGFTNSYPNISGGFLNTDGYN